MTIESSSKAARHLAAVIAAAAVASVGCGSAAARDARPFTLAQARDFVQRAEQRSPGDDLKTRGCRWNGDEAKCPVAEVGPLTDVTMNGKPVHSTDYRITWTDTVAEVHGRMRIVSDGALSFHALHRPLGQGQLRVTLHSRA